MKLMRIEAEGMTTSFRYPFFMMGRHPTFNMPPPATIYGHICSALGDTFDPHGVEFGYTFSYSASGSDLEHIHLLGESGGSFVLDGTKYPKRVEGAVNPFWRDLLFQPRLTLYVNKPEWLESFRSPYYPVVLGRSQDLFTYSNVAIIDAPMELGYLENTLLPFAFGAQSRGVSVVMPRFINYARNREAEFAPYTILMEPRPVFPDEETLIDPSTRLVGGRRRAIVLHRFVDD